MRRFVSLLLLSAALGAPVAIRADDQNEHHDRDRNRDRNRDRRYYDTENRDWHQWNGQEDRAYRRYLEEQRRQYREYGKLNKRDQREYWRWRHNHPDADDRR